MDPHINPASGVWDDNYYANKNKGGGGSSGGGGGAPAAPTFDPKPYNDLLANLPSAAGFATSLNAGEDSAFSDYLKYLSSQDSPLDFYTKASEANGVPALRKTQSTLQGQIYDLEDTLRRIEPDVTATTGESIVTDAQRRGIVTTRQKPVIENLGWLGQSLGRVSDAVTKGNEQALTLTDLQGQGVARTSDAYKTNLQIKSEQAARAMTGFTTDVQNTLDITLRKIARGEAVSDQQYQQAYDAWKLEKTYQLEMDKLAKTTANTAEKDRYISVGDKSSLYDTKTHTFVTSPSSTGTGGITPPVIPTSNKPSTTPNTNLESLGINPGIYQYLYGVK